MSELDERALRTPSFSEGTAVVLADGQAWTFPKPWLRLYPARDEAGAVYMGGGLSYGVEFEDAFDDLVELGDDDDADYQRHTLHLKLAAMLLLRNYALTDRHLRRLLTIDLENPGGPAMWGAINEVINARPPKPSADGSATP